MKTIVEVVANTLFLRTVSDLHFYFYNIVIKPRCKVVDTVNSNKNMAASTKHNINKYIIVCFELHLIMYCFIASLFQSFESRKDWSAS